MAQLMKDPFQHLIDSWIGLDYILNAPVHQKTTFPPYDTIKDGDDYRIVVALAGYKREDICIAVVDNTLIIEHKSTETVDNSPKVEYLHRGIARRSFKHTFNLSPEIKVDAAEMNDGMLTIYLYREIPQEKQPKLIKIN